MGRFPEVASEDLLAGTKRNFPLFDPLDFLAEDTQDIPDPGEHLIRYYGWYSNKSRGLRAKAQRESTPEADEAGPLLEPDRKSARKRWAALIKQVYEIDPLLCPKCGVEMKIIRFIERQEPSRRFFGLIWQFPSVILALNLKKQITIVGTQFILRTGQETQLDVTEGSVRFYSKHTEESAMVGKGEFARVRPDRRIQQCQDDK